MLFKMFKFEMETHSVCLVSRKLYSLDTGCIFSSASQKPHILLCINSCVITFLKHCLCVLSNTNDKPATIFHFTKIIIFTANSCLIVGMESLHYMLSKIQLTQFLLKI